MSFSSNKKYFAPRVEDNPSEVGDSPTKVARPTSRMRRPPTSAPDVRPDANRSSSDSGYSSKTDRSATSSAADSAIAGILGEDVAQTRTRATPYQNTHQPRKESVDKVRKPRPKSMAIHGTRANIGAMPPPPLPPYFQATPTTGGQMRPSMHHRNHTIPNPEGILSSSPAQQSMPQLYQQPPTASFSSGPSSFYSGYINSANASVGYDTQQPNYPHAQSSSGGYLHAQPSYPTSMPAFQQIAPFPIQPPTPTPGFAMPTAAPQRPALSHQQTAPVIHPAQPSSYGSHQTDPNQLNLNALALSTPLKKPRPADYEPFVDPRDNKIKCYRKGVLHVHNGSMEHIRRKLKAKKDRRREREDYSDSESSDSSSSYCSTCDPSSESGSELDLEEEEKGRMSPRKALHRTQSSRSGPQSPRKPSRPTSFASSRNSGEHPLAKEEKQKLSDMEEYQKQASTPRRQSTVLPAFIENTARATKTAASQRSSGSPPPPLPRSPARSRTSDTRRDDRRDSSINISAKDSLSFKPGEDGMITFNAPGQQIIMTINNNGQMTEKRYIASSSSQNSRRLNRRPSNASTTRSRESDRAGRVVREQYE